MNQTGYLQLPDCLVIPTPYLLQEFSEEDIIKMQDANGWGFMHWAVAEGNHAKIAELQECGFDFDIRTHNNIIPKDFFNQNCPNFSGYLFKSIIPFTSGGLTPLHLSVFLYNQFNLASHTGKNLIILDKLKNNQLSFFSNLDIEKFSIVDDLGLSVTDYCFLLENIEFLNILIQKDPTFSSLRKINSETAYKIISLYQEHKIKDHFDVSFKKQLTQILENLARKKTHDKLQTSLSNKNMIESKVVKI